MNNYRIVTFRLIMLLTTATAALSLNEPLPAVAATYVPGTRYWQGSYVDSRSNASVHRVPFRLTI